MKRATLIATGIALVLAVKPALAQPKVPVMALAPSSAKTLESFGAILGIRQLPSGALLVNDAGRRRLVLLDKSFAKSTVVIDSAAGATNSYGPRPAPLIAYLGDSSLFVDAASSSLLVIDPNGKVARVMAAPKPGDLRFLGGSQAYIDDKGRLLYRGVQMMRQRAPQLPGAKQAPIQPPDSAPILRADFDTRQVDTVGRVKLSSGARMNMEQGPDGKLQLKMLVNPVQTIDDWAVLSDGTLAFVRGHDYHIDLLHTNGTLSQGAKLPFDWKRLTDENKQQLVDSARTAMELAMKPTVGATPGTMTFGDGAMPAAGGGGGGGGRMVEIHIEGGAGGGAIGGGPPGQPMSMGAPKIDFVPLKEMADYYPAIRAGAARADLDGNLWILPTTSAQSQGGELVYDVVNKNGELFQRVRVPQGRSIAGFGRNGVLYLSSGDRTNGFYLERSSIIGGGARATQ